MMLNRLPFFKFSFYYSVFYLLVMVIIPIIYLFSNIQNLSLGQILEIIMNGRVISAFMVTISCSAIAAISNVFIGTAVAWVLVRYDFCGKRILDSLVDIPFALPTAISGIALADAYSNNGIGYIINFFGIEVLYSKLGIIIALIFVGIPFVVRSVQPVLSQFSKEVEDAAYFLGASKIQVFIKIILPVILPSLVTGFILAFARGMGEFGAVIFLAGNLPGLTETISFLIYTQIEQFNFETASVIAILALIVSFVIILSLNIIQKKIIKS